MPVSEVLQQAGILQAEWSAAEAYADTRLALPGIAVEGFAGIAAEVLAEIAVETSAERRLALTGITMEAAPLAMAEKAQGSRKGSPG